MTSNRRVMYTHMHNVDSIDPRGQLRLQCIDRLRLALKRHLAAGEAEPTYEVRPFPLTRMKEKAGELLVHEAMSFSHSIRAAPHDSPVITSHRLHAEIP